MARKGSHKVRTGCHTCKKRKVKCDETKPRCLRCTKTSRKCDGYTPSLPPGLASYSWIDLLGKRPIIPALTARRNTADGRALEFYHLVVAPAFSRFPGDDFWTRMVAQASLQEPAVHHAVVAISSFYELVDSGPFEKVVGSEKGRYAVVQYNRALQELRQMRDESVVLFVCVLFICIEALREDKQGAMTHCRYGIKVFNGSQGSGSQWAREYFRPLFVRLTCCPYFFGATIDYFPSPAGAEEEDVSGPHGSWDVCRYRMDLMVMRCVRFVREYEIPAPNLPPKPPPNYSSYGERRDRLVAMLDVWLASYDGLFARLPPPADNLSPYLMMVMMCLVCRIWVSACGAQDEMAYDEHLETFAEIVDLARQAAEVEKAKMQSNRTTLHRSKFVLEMGFVPTLYFVVIKCRNLALRQAALDYMTMLAPERENLWNATLLYSVGKKIIELEHGESSKTVAKVPDEQDPPQLRVKGLATLPVKSREEMTSALPPLLGTPPPCARVRDALVLGDPDVRLPGKGLGGLPHRPSRSVQFVVGGAAAPVVSQLMVPMEEPAVTGAPEGVVGMAAPGMVGAVLEGVELPLTPPDEVVGEIKRGLEAERVMGVYPTRETGLETS